MAITIRRKPDLYIADCQVSDVAGHMVRISSDVVGGVYQATKIDILSDPIELPWGMIISKQGSTRCIVQVRGEVRGIYTGLTPGHKLFIGSDSLLTHTIPIHPTSGVKSVHPAAQALSSNALLLRQQTPVVISPINP